MKKRIYISRGFVTFLSAVPFCAWGAQSPKTPNDDFSRKLPSCQSIISHFKHVAQLPGTGSNSRKVATHYAQTLSSGYKNKYLAALKAKNPQISLNTIEGSCAKLEIFYGKFARWLHSPGNPMDEEKGVRAYEPKDLAKFHSLYNSVLSSQDEVGNINSDSPLEKEDNISSSKAPKKEVGFNPVKSFHTYAKAWKSGDSNKVRKDQRQQRGKYMDSQTHKIKTTDSRFGNHRRSDEQRANPWVGKPFQVSDEILKKKSATNLPLDELQPKVIGTHREDPNEVN